IGALDSAFSAVEEQAIQNGTCPDKKITNERFFSKALVRPGAREMITSNCPPNRLAEINAGFDKASASYKKFLSPTPASCSVNAATDSLRITTHAIEGYKAVFMYDGTKPMKIVILPTNPVPAKPNPEKSTVEMVYNPYSHFEIEYSPTGHESKSHWVRETFQEFAYRSDCILGGCATDRMADINLNKASGERFPGENRENVFGKSRPTQTKPFGSMNERELERATKVLVAAIRFANANGSLIRDPIALCKNLGGSPTADFKLPQNANPALKMLPRPSGKSAIF
ncbi:MAG: hypothetical protein V4692_10970, partial [Bdellovibrionota bacterium]